METTDEMIWEARIRKCDVPNMSDEEIKTLQQELINSVRRICWDYGIHN